MIRLLRMTSVRLALAVIPLRNDSLIARHDEPARQFALGIPQRFRQLTRPPGGRMTGSGSYNGFSDS